MKLRSLNMTAKALISVACLSLLIGLPSASASLTHIRSLPTPNRQVYGHFGQSMATSPGNVIVVGAGNQTADGYVGAGHAYTFETNVGKLKHVFTSPNAQAYGNFGESVALSAGGKLKHPTASRVIVGAPNETVDGYLGAGRAYIFNTSTGVLSRTLVSPNAQSGGEFGWSVTASGSVVVVGAPDETVNGYAGAGRAYLFNSTTGKLMITFTSPTPQTDGHFGQSLGISVNSVNTPGRFVVGAPGEGADGHASAGRAYVFGTANGKQLAILTSPNAQEDGDFGWSVSLTNKIVAVGAPGETSNGFRSAGNAYLFNGGDGKLLFSLTSPNAQSSGGFGWSVWLSEQTLGVGAPNETVDGRIGAGRAYAFQDENGTLIKSYTSRHVQTDGSFGFSITVVQGPGYPGYIIGVGAPNESAHGLIASGNAYV